MRAKTIVPGLLHMSSHPAKWKRDEKLAWIGRNVNHVFVLARLDDPELRSLTAVTYHHVQLVDGHKALDQKAYAVAAEVANLMRAGEPCLVACLVGRSRSGAVCTLAVRDYFNVTGTKALDQVRFCRPGAVKREGPEAELRSLPKPKPGKASKALPNERELRCRR